MTARDMDRIADALSAVRMPAQPEEYDIQDRGLGTPMNTSSVPATA